jgi:hypothetical protein
MISSEATQEGEGPREEKVAAVEGGLRSRRLVHEG